MNNNRLFILALLITICIGVFTSIDGYGLEYDVNFDESIYINSEDVIQKQVERPIGRYKSVEAAIEGVGGQLLKEYDYTDETYFITFKGVVRKNFEIASYRYDEKTGDLYLNTDSSSWVELKHEHSDGDWYDFDFAHGIIIDGIDYECYIPGGNEYDDVYFGLWFGDKIKDTTSEKGELEYSLITGIKEEENIYFWTYELEDSKELLNTVLQHQIDPPGKNGRDTIHYTFKLKDVRNLLGVKTKTSIDYRMIIYWLICAVLMIVVILLFKKTSAMNTAGGLSLKRVLCWIVSIMLSFILASMVGYYISNPRLVFGMHGINDVIEKLIGYRIPNAF